jgi:primosomal protein N' (replication factor Y)
MRYPPTVALINAIVRGKTARAALDDAGDLAGKLRSIETGRSLAGPPSFYVLGPAPAPLMRLKGEHRAQIFLKGTKRSAMRDACKAALDAFPEMKRRVVIDVDPLSVL